MTRRFALLGEERLLAEGLFTPQAAVVTMLGLGLILSPTILRAFNAAKDDVSQMAANPGADPGAAFEPS